MYYAYNAMRAVRARKLMKKYRGTGQQRLYWLYAAERCEYLRRLQLGW